MGRAAAHAFCAVLVSVSGFACGAAGDDAPFTIELRIAPTPPTVGPTRVVVQLSSRSGAPVPEAVVVIRAAPVEATTDSTTYDTSAEAGNRYSVRALSFDRPGPWTLSVRIETPEGQRFERSFSTSVVPPVGANPQ